MYNRPHKTAISNVSSSLTKLSPVICYHHGIDPMESCNIDGLLLENYSSDEEVSSWMMKNSDPYKAVIISTSLAGDCIGDDISRAIHVTDKNLLQDAVQRKFRTLAEQLSSLAIQILFCQKVVHPFLKTLLEERGILVFTRVGLSIATTLSHACSVPVAHQLDIDSRFVGSIASLSPTLHHGKRYLKVQVVDPINQLSTLILCASTECALDELKLVSRGALCSIGYAFNNPSTVPGGGCFETRLATILRASRCTNGLPCTEDQYRAVALAVAKSFETVAMAIGGPDYDHYVDSLHAHHWLIAGGMDVTSLSSLSCCCGMFEKTPTIELNPMLELRHSTTVSNASIQLEYETEVRRVPLVQDLLSSRIEAIVTAFEASASIARVGKLGHRSDRRERPLTDNVVQMF